MSDMLLNVENVTYGYSSSDWSLAGISFGVGEGDFLGIVGPNGSGKSTLLKLAAGIVECREGRVLVGGEDIKAIGRRAVAMSVGYLPQSVNSAFDYKVDEVVAMGRFARLKGLGFLGGDDLAAVERCMMLTDTKRYRGRRLSQLSGGERQRVMLASVLAQEPKVLLLDEPTTGLDIHHQVSFFRLLKKLTGEGLAVAVVTHELNLASLFCEKVMLLNEGRMVTAGTPGETFVKDVLEGIYPGNLYIGRHPESDTPMILPTTYDGMGGGVL